MRVNPFRRSTPRRGRSRMAGSDGWLKPETRQAIAGVVLLLVSVVLLLSFFGQAGRAGDGLLMLFRLLFGRLTLLAPLVLAYVGVRLLRPGREPLARWRLAGLALLGLGLLGLFHTIGVELDDSLQVAYDGRGGGLAGFLLTYPLSLALSALVTGLVFAAAAIIGVFMTFDISPHEAAVWLKGLVPRREASEEELDGYEDEEAASVKPARFHISPLSRPVEPDQQQLALEQREKQQAEARRNQVKAANKRYTPPSLDLLATSTRQPEGGDIEANMESIQRTLENFNLQVEMGKARVGPTVTQYTLRPDEGVRLSQITALQNDLARALKAHPVRIEAPIPNTDLVGIEIPNKEVALVRLRDLLVSREMKRSDSPLTLALGKDVTGKTVTAELDRMPHLLIAGATNSGKSVSIHTILMSLLYRNSPQLLRLVLVDPKRVELAVYNGIPHLWGESVIVDTHKTLNALKWALREMDRRYKLLEESGSRNLLSYNINNTEEPLPFVVIVIDELADLMAKHGREVEGPIVRLCQLARAVGIHLVLATQRPSVNVITGLIKANIPARVAFKVASQVDSRTILDMSGAEKLVGTGDMLFSASDNSKPLRLQGGFVSEDEVRNVVKNIIENNEMERVDEIDSITSTELTTGGRGGGDEADDPLFEEARRTAVEAGKVSASYLQRRLRIGYARAARLLDVLEEHGVIGPAEGNKPREVLLDAGSDDGEDEFGSEIEEGDGDAPTTVQRDQW